MNETIKGRTDPLKMNSTSLNAGGVKTGSTFTSENT